MTRAEKLTYVESLEARIVELEEQVQRQAQRILTLAGVDATTPGFDVTGGAPFGVQCMAAGMKLPTTTTAIAAPTAALPAGITRMARGMKLPTA